MLQIKTAQLELELARAELAALRGQLHPHFLFNCFNALSTLVRQRKNDVAVEIIAQLSVLLRLAIDRTGFQEVSLLQEIDFVERYLKLEQVRFGEKLNLRIDIQPEALHVLIPNVILQPLVENGIKHGISKISKPGLISIKAYRENDRLRIEIVNDGPVGEMRGGSLFLFGNDNRSGIGESNTHARLERIFGLNYRFERHMRPEGGAIVTLDLPWRPVPPSAAP